MIDQIQNGEIGSSVRTKLNSVIDIANRAGVQLLASGSVDLNLPASSLPYPRLQYNSGAGNANLTYSGLTGTFVVGEHVTDGNGNDGVMCLDSAGSMSLAYVAVSVAPPFPPGDTITGSISAATATIDTVVSNSLFTPGETIVSIVNNSVTADIVTSQTGSITYGTYSEITGATGLFTSSYISFSMPTSINPWIPGETITDTTSGATATLVYTPNFLTLVLKDITGSFSNGDTVSGSLSGNTNGLNGDLASNYGYDIAIGQTSGVAANVNTLSTTYNTDQPFTLSGGSKFAVTDVVMTNGSGTFSYAGDPYLYTLPYGGGNVVAQGAGGFMLGGSIAALLQSPDNYINYGAYLDGHDGIEIGTNGIQPTTVGNTLYYSNTPNGDAATADIYIYGYILA